MLQTSVSETFLRLLMTLTNTKCIFAILLQDILKGLCWLLYWKSCCGFCAGILVGTLVIENLVSLLCWKSYWDSFAWTVVVLEVYYLLCWKFIIWLCWKYIICSCNVKIFVALVLEVLLWFLCCNYSCGSCDESRKTLSKT